MQDREQLKRTLAESLKILVRAMRAELARNNVVTTEAVLLQRCRDVMGRSFDAMKAQRRRFISDEELALRRELLEEILTEELARTAN